MKEQLHYPDTTMEVNDCPSNLDKHGAEIAYKGLMSWYEAGTLRRSEDAVDFNPSRSKLRRFSRVFLEKCGLTSPQHLINHPSPEENSQMGKIIISGVPFVFQRKDLLDVRPNVGDFISITSKVDNTTRYLPVGKIEPSALSQGAEAPPAKRLSSRRGRKLMELNTPVADDVRFSIRN